VTKQNTRERSHLESKKFVAWFLSEMTWKVILVVALVQWRSNPADISVGAWWIMLSIVVTSGFIGIGFILGQAALDKYVRVAEIAAEQVASKVPKPPAPADEPEHEQTDPKVST
jgi:hypothetical protein